MFAFQSDFASFSKNSSANWKLNNFLKLEPPLRQLNIAVDANMIHDIMLGICIAIVFFLFSVCLSVSLRLPPSISLPPSLSLSLSQI